MSEITPASLMVSFKEILGQLDITRKEMAEADLDCVEKRAKYKRAYARAYLNTEGSIEHKKQTTELLTADLRLDVERAEAVLRAHQEAVRMLRDRLEVSRSVSSILKMEWQQA